MISEISEENINKKVKIIAEIKRQRSTNKSTFFEFKDESAKIKGIIFEKIEILENNKEYNIEGKITKYKKELEIIIGKIYIK